MPINFKIDILRVRTRQPLVFFKVLVSPRLCVLKSFRFMSSAPQNNSHLVSTLEALIDIKKSQNKTLADFKPVIIAILPFSFIWGLNEKFLFTCTIPVLSELGIYSLLIPPLLSTLFILTRSWAGIWASRGIAFVQLGWVKVGINEAGRKLDTLLDLNGYVMLKRLWNSDELREIGSYILSAYPSIKIHPTILNKVILKSNASVVDFRILLQSVIEETMKLQELVDDRSALAIWWHSNGITVMAGAVVSGIVTLLFTGLGSWLLKPRNSVEVTNNALGITNTNLHNLGKKVDIQAAMLENHKKETALNFEASNKASLAADEIVAKGWKEVASKLAEEVLGLQEVTHKLHEDQHSLAQSVRSSDTSRVAMSVELRDLSSRVPSVPKVTPVTDPSEFYVKFPKK